MNNRIVLALALLIGVLALVALTQSLPSTKAEDFVSLFDGKSLQGWKVPEGDNGHWKVVAGVIDYDAGSEATGDKDLWTAKEYGDFVLRVDWRIKETP